MVVVLRVGLDTRCAVMAIHCTGLQERLYSSTLCSIVLCAGFWNTLSLVAFCDRLGPCCNTKYTVMGRVEHTSCVMYLHVLHMQ